MMAAAMASRASVELRFSQLAKDAVTVTRDIDTTRLTRVLELGEFDSPTVEVDFAFTMVGERPQVSVTHDFAMKRDCQWCLEPKATVVELRAATMLAVSEEQASAWQLEDDAAYIVGQYQEAIAVANPNSFDEVAWLEDELLAAWPSQVCVSAREMRGVGSNSSRVRRAAS